MHTDPSGHQLVSVGMAMATVTVFTSLALAPLPAYGKDMGVGVETKCVIFVGETINGNPVFENAGKTKKEDRAKAGIKCDVVDVHSGKEMVDEIDIHAKLKEMHYYGHSGDGLWMFMGNGRESLYTDNDYAAMQYGVYGDDTIPLGGGAASISDINPASFVRTAEVYLWGCGAGQGGELSFARQLQSHLGVMMVSAFTGSAAPHNMGGGHVSYDCKSHNWDSCHTVEYTD